MLSARQSEDLHLKKVSQAHATDEVRRQERSKQGAYLYTLAQCCSC